eukprot:CAMPEP_0198492074 /NCGR_PEP_ID=MMETSP1462-20131121/3216_1 /TAXON_ID=1333877 /ORGANISM="Brandtodinium nutriculum, Strain RCC3387" /LENGTH=115 /DNA_ID=CAMNT_0044220709 /DNA_START=158 /DNA_END=506 /DNA_ORIENTATION=-
MHIRKNWLEAAHSKAPKGAAAPRSSPGVRAFTLHKAAADTIGWMGSKRPLVQANPERLGARCATCLSRQHLEHSDEERIDCATDSATGVFAASCIKPATAGRASAQKLAPVSGRA